MRKIFLTSLGLLSSVLAASAFKLPSGFHQVDQLTEAQNEAFEKKEPVVYLISRIALNPS